MKATLFLSAMIGLSISTLTNARALAAGPPPAPPHHVTSSVQVPPGTTHRVRGVVVNAGFYNGSASGGTTLDAQTIACNSKAGSCTFSMSAMIQFCNSSGFSDSVGIIVYVDRTLADYSFNDIQNETCLTPTVMASYSVDTGTHSVDFQTYNQQTEYVGNWEDRTDITTP